MDHRNKSTGEIEANWKYYCKVVKINAEFQRDFNNYDYTQSIILGTNKTGPFDFNTNYKVIYKRIKKNKRNSRCSLESHLMDY